MPMILIQEGPMISLQDLLWAGAVILSVMLYGALHSLLAATRVKETLKGKIGPLTDRTYRLFYNLLGGITFIPTLLMVGLHPGALLYRLPFPWSTLGFLLQGAAVLAILAGLKQTGPMEFLGLEQLSGKGGEEEEVEFVVQGLYRWVRHPLYTAGLLFLWSTPFLTVSTLAMNLALTLYIILGSLHEESRLLDQFGETYRAYQRQVPSLIPQPWRPPPDLP